MGGKDHAAHLVLVSVLAGQFPWAKQRQSWAAFILLWKCCVEEIIHSSSLGWFKLGPGDGSWHGGLLSMAEEERSILEPLVVSVLWANS